MSTNPTRRSVVAGAAWTLPAVVMAGAAPAMAASSPLPCTVTTSWWDYGANQSTGALANPAVLSNASITVIATNSGATGKEGNFYANNGSDPAANSPGAYPNNLRLRSETSGTNEQTMAPQFVTITFSKPVVNVSLTVSDIDRDLTGPNKSGFQDQIYIPNGQPRPAVQLGSGLSGTGVATDPWQMSSTVADGNKAAGAAYNLTLTWAGPVTSIQIAYKQGSRQYNSFPTVWISPVTFTRTDC